MLDKIGRERPFGVFGPESKIQPVGSTRTGPEAQSRPEHPPRRGVSACLDECDALVPAAIVPDVGGGGVGGVGGIDARRLDAGGLLGRT